MIINRRSLLAALGLTFPALAGAEAATKKKKKATKPKAPLHTHKTASRKPAHHTTKPKAPAQS